MLVTRLTCGRIVSPFRCQQANIQAKSGRGETEVRGILTARNPQARLIAPEEVAETVLWLCTNDVGSITGQSIAVAGGELM